MCHVGLTAPKFLKAKVDELPNHIMENEVVMAGFIDSKSEDGTNIFRTLLKISKQKELSNGTFLVLNYNRIDKQQREKMEVFQPNTIHLFLKAHKKKYHGKIDPKHIYSWIHEILNSDVQVKNSRGELGEMDSHYFVYLKRGYWE